MRSAPTSRRGSVWCRRRPRAMPIPRRCFRRSAAAGGTANRWPIYRGPFMTRRMLIMLACVLALIAALGLGFYVHIRQMISDPPKPSPQTISTVKVEALEWQPQLAAVGTLSAVRGVDISSEIVGLVREVNFKSGQDVKAGDLLIQLNADADIAQMHAFEAAADLAAVVLERDKAQLEAEAVSRTLGTRSRGTFMTVSDASMPASSSARASSSLCSP